VAKDSPSLRSQTTLGVWRSCRAPLALYLAASAVFVLAEAAIFRSGFYEAYLEPLSIAGTFEQALRDELRRQRIAPREILVLGDSRIGEGFSAPLANRTVAGSGFAFVNVAVPGTMPRAWYYMLRDLDADASRYFAVILPVDDYDDEDGLEDMADRELDLRNVIARLRLSDIWDFARSYNTVHERFEVARNSLFKGFVYKQDAQAFLEHPVTRLRDVRRHRMHGFEWRESYPGRPQSLTGLSIDWRKMTMTFPPDLPADQRAALMAILLRPVASQTGAHAAYRRLWFGRIIERDRRSATWIVFVRIPRAPIPRPDWLVHKLSSSIRELGARPHVLLLDEDTFDDLERPEVFFDGLHLNAAGRERFSVSLAQYVTRRLRAVVEVVGD
jgi:hypothetical protein